MLNSKELKNRVMEGSSGAVEGLLARGRFENKGHGSKGRSKTRSEEGDLLEVQLGRPYLMKLPHKE